MRRSVTFFTLVIQFLQLNGQTFIDCSNIYYEAYNKVSLQLTLKEIDEKHAKTLKSTINANLDSCIIGKEVPDYILVGLSGKTYTNASLEGKVVVFNFWYVNCGPCIVEIPVLTNYTFHIRTIRTLCLFQF